MAIRGRFHPRRRRRKMYSSIHVDKPLAWRIGQRGCIEAFRLQWVLSLECDALLGGAHLGVTASFFL